MENKNKSQAEIYREERKERLAKAAAKNAKKSPKVSKVKKVVGKVIAIVLAVVIALGALVGILNFFGTPEKLIKVSTSGKEYSFSLGEFNYYYFQVWSTYQNQAYQYESYYKQMTGSAGGGVQATGYDYTKAPGAQEYVDDYAQITGVTVADLGVKEPTWADVFRYATVTQIIQIKYSAQKAKEAGITLTDDDKNEINTSIDEIRTKAKESDYSLDRYLRAQFGNGVTEKAVRQIQEESALASAYFEKLKTDITNGVTEDQVNAKYNENKDDYDIVSLRLYAFSTDEVKTADGATEEEKKAAQEKAYEATKARADAFLEVATDEEAFIKRAELELKKDDPESKSTADEVTKCNDFAYADFAQQSEELAKWAFDDARKLGDKTVIDNGNGTYFAVLMTVLPHQDKSFNNNDVRHILIQFPKDDEGNTVELTDKVKAETKAKAQAILDEYLKDPTEENFAKLATEKTEDPGSKDNGGLYEDVTKESNYVEPFLNWSTDAARKTGDTGIVETSYGYHIMYYVSGDGVKWYEDIKEMLVTERYNAVFDEVNEKFVKTFKINSTFLKSTTKKQNKLIEKILLNNYI